MKRLSGILFILGFILAGCSDTAIKGMKPSLDFSRGVQIAASVAGSLGMYAEQDGSAIHLVWPQRVGSQIKVRYMQLDETASPVLDLVVGLPPSQVRSPRILPAGDGGNHLFWASRPVGGGEWELWYARFQPSKGELDEAVRLSTLGQSVRSFSYASDGKGGALLVWYLVGDDGVYYEYITPEGETLPQPLQIVSGGFLPSIRVDTKGQAHLAWLEEGGVFYTAFDPSIAEQVRGEKVAKLTLGTGITISGFDLALSDGWVYILWSVLNESGAEAGTAFTKYVVFPAGDVAPGNTERIEILSLEDLPFQNFVSEHYLLSEIVAPLEDPYGSDYVYGPVSVQGQAAETAIGLSFSQSRRLDIYPQLALAIFGDGKLKGYTPVSKTLALSKEPVVAADADGELYVAWREGASGNKIYFATTAEEAKKQLDQLSSDDLASLVVQGGMESLVGIMFFPVIGLGLITPGLVIVGIWRLYRDFESITDRGSQAVVATAIIIFTALKVWVLSISTYVPFSAWLDINRDYHLAIQIIVPLVIAAIGFLATLVVYRRRGGLSSITFYLAYTVVDSILTLGVYGVVLLGVY